MSVWTSSFVFWSKLLMPEFGKFGNLLYLCAPKPKGEVLEWLKRHAWKACIPLKGITSSNLVLSAYSFSL